VNKGPLSADALAAIKAGTSRDLLSSLLAKPPAKIAGNQHENQVKTNSHSEI
jgi:hypothetical protein